MYTLTPEQQLLPDILHREEARFPTDRMANLDATGWDALFHLAVELRVVPAVYERLKQQIATPNEPTLRTLHHFAAYSREVAKNNLRYFGELQRYLTHLTRAGIPVIPLKGIWLAHDVYSGKGMREMNDMDLLFRRDDLPEALRIVTELGYTSDGPVRIREHMQQSHHLPPVIRRDSAVFELHWNITRPGRIYYIDPETLWEHARAGRMTGIDVMLLSPEDQLLHLALHTSYQHMFAFGLRPFFDIATTIGYFRGDGSGGPPRPEVHNTTGAISAHDSAPKLPALDWDRFCDRCIAFGWQRGVRMALTLSRDLVGADVPAQVLDRLGAGQGADRELLDVAVAQLFTRKETVAQIPMPVDILSEIGLLSKLKIAWQRIFIPESHMITRYDLEPGSKWRYFYYLVRVQELLRNNTTNLIRLLRGEKTMTGVVERKRRLELWLNEDFTG